MSECYRENKEYCDCPAMEVRKISGIAANVKLIPQRPDWLMPGDKVGFVGYGEILWRVGVVMTKFSYKNKKMVVIKSHSAFYVTDEERVKKIEKCGMACPFLTGFCELDKGHSERDHETTTVHHKVKWSAKGKL